MSDLSTRVRLRREQLGLSQEELARAWATAPVPPSPSWKKASTICPSPKWRSWRRRWRPLPPLCWGWTRPAPVPRALSRCHHGAGAADRLHRLRHPHHRRAEHRVLYRGARRVARGFCPDLPRRQYVSHDMQRRHRMHPLPARGGAGRDRRRAGGRGSHPQALPPAGRCRDAAGR